MSAPEELREVLRSLGETRTSTQMQWGVLGGNVVVAAHLKCGCVHVTQGSTRAEALAALKNQLCTEARARVERRRKCFHLVRGGA